jgi:hypothetical protein
MEKITTFNEYQKKAVSMRVSLNEFQKKFPNTDYFILKLLSVAYDGLGLGEAGEVQGILTVQENLQKIRKQACTWNCAW